MQTKCFVACLIPLLGLTGCVEPYYAPSMRTSGWAGYAPKAPGLATQDQTAGIENADRIARFRRLAAMQGTTPPQVTQIMLPPNSVSYMSSAVPVVRVVFDEKIFFDFNSDVPRPEAGPVFDLLAENMRRDVPDAALTVLGHTDAIGTDAYNVSLSSRRAAKVMGELVRRGVRASQLSEVAIGKRQPIAPNDTEAGRARNRRVEFLVSSGIDANLAAVQQRVVPLTYFSLGPDKPPPVRTETVAQVLRIKPTEAPQLSRLPPGDATLEPYAGLPLRPPANEDIQRAGADSIASRPIESEPEMLPPAEVRPVQLVKPEPLHLLPLGDPQSY
jgi:outer membrane protein OmpA-like peptidoglycan-associated protein